MNIRHKHVFGFPQLSTGGFHSEGNKTRKSLSHIRLLVKSEFVHLSLRVRYSPILHKDAILSTRMLPGNIVERMLRNSQFPHCIASYQNAVPERKDAFIEQSIAVTHNITRMQRESEFLVGRMGETKRESSVEWQYLPTFYRASVPQSCKHYRRLG